MRKRVSANSGQLWLDVPQANREGLKSELPQVVLRESKFVSFSNYSLLPLICYSALLFAIPLLVLLPLSQPLRSPSAGGSNSSHSFMKQQRLLKSPIARLGFTYSTPFWKPSSRVFKNISRNSSNSSKVSFRTARVLKFASPLLGELLIVLFYSRC